MADSRLRTKQELKRLFRNLKRKGITDDMMNILIDTLWRDRVVNRTSGFYFPGGEDCHILFENSSRTFTIQPVDPLVDGYKPRFLFYSFTNRPVLQRKYYVETIVLPDEEGLFVVYYKSDESNSDYVLAYKKNPTEEELQAIYEDEIVITFIYWDATAKQALTFGEDRHGSEWNPQIHWYLHNAFHGRRNPGGLNVTGMQINEDGSADAHAQFSVTAGGFSHDDIPIAVDSAAGGTSAIPVLYFSGAGSYPRFSSQTGFQVLNSGRLVYNQNSQSLTQCTNGWFVAYHVFATNDRLDGQQIISVAGQNQYEKLAEAFAQVQNEVNTIYGLSPQQGLCYLGSVIYQTSDAYTNAVKARIAGFSGDEEHPAVSIAPGSEDYLSINEDQELAFDADALQFADGLSAYEIAVQNGFVGTEAEWLASLVGAAGNDGAGVTIVGSVTSSSNLDPSYTGDVGDMYIAQDTGHGWVWDGSTWNDVGQIQGPQGDTGNTGASAYQVAVANGFTGTEAEWLASLEGTDGTNGTNGTDGADGADGDDGLSAYEVAVQNGFSGTEAEWLASLKGDDGDPGLITVDTTCGDEQITNTTDIIAILDTTSGPYTNSDNVDSVVASLNSWFSAYQTANPDFQGNLYIGKNNVEDYVAWLPQLRTNYASGFVWISGYEMTANAGSEVFLICFVNESNPSYHDSTTPAAADTPTAAFISDYNEFVTARGEMDFFGSVVYPVVALNPTGVESNFLINTYAVMNSPSNLSETAFATQAGTNYDNASYDFSSTANPYASYPLGPYGFTAVLNKHTVGGSTAAISFTAAEFAEDINAILSGANATTSQVSLFQSYVNQILTLRGLRSNTISLEILPGGCIQMEVDESASGGSGGDQVQSDWAETDPTAASFIKNKDLVTIDRNINGGSAASVYLPTQIISGGGANG
ncbi:hypothetical protein [uncultured Draconibacterium sp.]|uniref:hypothetical protein n=1 Tax=uncultured Draconibacterium sp. TaxID=1573823 RepID=UPI0025E64986|nr:hypothetical protein [uncultured Draconibacterium sp.]